MKGINVGGGHTIVAERIISIINYGSRPTIRLKQEFETKKMAIDLTGGDKVRALVLSDGYMFLCSVKADTLNQRLEKTE